MTRKDNNRTISEIKAMMAEDGEFLRPMVRAVIQEFLEAEMAEAVGAEKGERAEGRISYRSGYYPRSLITRVGKLELRVPQDRNGHEGWTPPNPTRRQTKNYPVRALRANAKKDEQLVYSFRWISRDEWNEAFLSKDARAHARKHCCSPSENPFVSPAPPER